MYIFLPSSIPLAIIPALGESRYSLPCICPPLRSFLHLILSSPSMSNLRCIQRSSTASNAKFLSPPAWGPRVAQTPLCTTDLGVRSIHTHAIPLSYLSYAPKMCPSLHCCVITPHLLHHVLYRLHNVVVLTMFPASTATLRTQSTGKHPYLRCSVPFPTYIYRAESPRTIRVYRLLAIKVTALHPLKFHILRVIRPCVRELINTFRNIPRQ